MTDCANAEMRDQLPDLLHERLDRGARAAVEAHLASCAECRAELELLRGIRASALTPRIDTARIAAAVAAQRPAHRSPSVSRLPSSVSSWRIAAAIAVMVIGGTSVATVLQHRGGTLGRDSIAAAQIVRPELSLGDAYGDLTDAQLAAVLSDIPKLDGLPVTEPDVMVPMSPLPGNGATE
jgi:anti-sigma factor RsiW